MRRMAFALCVPLAFAVPLAAQDFDQIQIGTSQVRGSIYLSR